jgi:ribosomal protein S18 acetylase RimI-like enzyme
MNPSGANGQGARPGDGLATGQPTSLRTYRAVHPNDGHVRRHSGFWAVTTPANPSFFWGNFLQFDAPPTAADVDLWPALFYRFVADPHPGASHVALCWETEHAGAVDAFVARGFEHTSNLVMTAPRVLPARRPSVDCTLRRLETEPDWEALVHFHVRARDPQFPEAGYRAYVRPRVAQWRLQSEAGTGLWVGAFVGAELAAALGLYAEVQPGPDGQRLARFQEVATEERWRRRGLCSALLAHAAERMTSQAVDRHVIITDEHDVARQVYAARGCCTPGASVASGP